MSQRFPNFLVIGAQKAGTSWLHRVLSEQSTIWLPPLKEIHYFDRKFPVKNHQNTGSGAPASGPGRDIKQRFRRFSISKLLQYLAQLDIQRIAWELNYYGGKRDDDWYASLFKQAGHRITGDITPAYSRLDDDAVRYVHQLIPEAKILFLLRNPIERAWSHAVMDLARFRHRSIDEVSDEEFHAHFKSTASVLRGSYFVTINRWRKHYSEERFFIGFFDDVGQAPKQLLSDVLAFLNMPEDDSIANEILTTKVNAGKSTTIPDKFRVALTEQYMEELVNLADIAGGRATEWLEVARKL